MKTDRPFSFVCLWHAGIMSVSCQTQINCPERGIYHENAKKGILKKNQAKQRLILLRELCTYGYYSVILSPRVITLGAAEEPDLTLISSPELAEPPDCKVVCTLGALDLDGGHSINFIFLVIHNHDLLLLSL